MRGYGVVAPDGTRRDSLDLGFPNWEFGETYRVLYILDPDSELVTFEHYRLDGDAFELEYQFDFAYDPSSSLGDNLTWLGAYNSLHPDDYIGSQLTVRLDNMRFGEPCVWDLTDDWFIGQADLGVLLAWYDIGDGGDMDGDGDTDQADLGSLLSHYGEPCP